MENEEKIEKEYKILSCSEPVDEAKQILDEVGTLLVEENLSRGELLQKIDSYDAILAGSTIEYDDFLFERAGGKLKIVSRVGVGYDNVDVEAATKHGVMVTNTPGVMAESVAEHAIMLMLASAKNLVRADRETREGEWKWGEYRGEELWNKTLGEIGLGRIGSNVARKARKGFGMRVLVHDPYVSESEVLELGGKYEYLDSLLKESDIVNLNVPLTEETYHLLGEDELQKMKTSAILVNTSRGAVVNEKALIKALKNGQIAKAGLDVLEQEPPEKENPLFEMDNVILTPHQGSNTRNGVRRMFVEAAQCAANALQGKKPKFLVNEKIWE
ncbi:hypothetical protein AKJ65_02695 [candidate division MSBL1 archaeon SCGC-AAA259E19]|uniref:Glyoxylate reductase n=2 Tax=candidate division MSBL1 TaxID=215777 RepID=A0A133UA10_9EURY|nr:hypothetical protein AKJ64_05060 [candidate division MSBL1 archaeon SCGC-AAA259E17]KXA95043.1 hypothetical protein AKJ65_02695 [candidate division MSBL1 archaeon SCGC-AAA259E19]